MKNWWAEWKKEPRILFGILIESGFGFIFLSDLTTFMVNMTDSTLKRKLSPCIGNNVCEIFKFSHAGIDYAFFSLLY